MLQIMTDKERKEAGERYDAFWNSLDFITKSHICHFLKDIVDSKDIRNIVHQQNKESQQRFLEQQKRINQNSTTYTSVDE